MGSCDRSLKIGVGVRATDSDSDNYLCRSFTTTCTMHRDEEHFSEQIDLGWDVLETNHQNSAQIWRSCRMTPYLECNDIPHPPWLSPPPADKTDLTESFDIDSFFQSPLDENSDFQPVSQDD